MKALRLADIEKLDMVTIEPPAIDAEQLLIKTGAAMICTSDLNDIRENPFHIRFPVILGHEGAGTVVQVGAAVSGFRPGDRVAAHPVHPCRRCDNCRRGLLHLCADMGHFGLNMSGTFAEYFAVRADRARKLPDSVPFVAAALAEPVCVCLEALYQARLAPGESVLILGDGPFGILTARLAHAFLPAAVVIAGHHAFRLSFAGQATAVNTTGALDPVAAVRQASGRSGFDAVILAAGSAQAVTQGIELLNAKGRFIVFSALPGKTAVDLFQVHLKELEIIGACNDQERLDRAVELLADPQLGIEALVTHRFRFGEYRRALETAEKGKESAIKVALLFE